MNIKLNKISTLNRMKAPGG